LGCDHALIDQVFFEKSPESFFNHKIAINKKHMDAKLSSPDKKSNKILLIIAVVVIIVGVGVGIYLATQNKNANSNTSTASNTTNQVNTPAPQVTYEPFEGSESGYSFDVIAEWTSIAPAEIQKSITEEQRHGYEIVYFSSSTDMVSLAVSEKKSEELSDLEEIVADDRSVSANNQDVTIMNERLGQTDARTELKITAGANEFVVTSRYLLLPPTAANETRWTLMEITVPTNRTNQYRDIVTHLLDSLKLTSSENGADTAAANDFAATGEKINGLLLGQNFSTIELGALPKNASVASASYNISKMNYSNEELAYHFITTDSAAAESQMTLKVYDYTAGKLFEGSQELTVKRGDNNFCCFSPPGQGQYQYMFYLGADLIKILELTSE
jgi:hypothetical protein